jgi:hypothetical protein
MSKSGDSRLRGYLCARRLAIVTVVIDLVIAGGRVTGQGRPL